MEPTLTHINTNIRRTIQYAHWLEKLGLTFFQTEYYYQVGEITRTEGWILHISGIQSELPELLERVLPALQIEGVPFKVVMDKNTAGMLIEGSLGYIQLAKLISVYPENDQTVVKMARVLIELTQGLRGPAIPTDYHLGNTVYTRYGSFNPIWAMGRDGSSRKMIHDAVGTLVPDPYSVPFVLHHGISWPFSEIKELNTQPKSKMLNGRYYCYHMTKPDVKGGVMKAFYFRRFLQIKSCIVKQGKKDMAVDDFGRDMRDRLRWQYDVATALKGHVPTAEVIEYFEYETDGYLAMEYVPGTSLSVWINSIYRGRCWLNLSISEQERLLSMYEKILSLVGTLHQRGYYHRDINAFNFLISKGDQITLIDLELVWSHATDTPAPPFGLGSLGYMPPEQQRLETPTEKEDVYALAGLFMVFFSNLDASKLCAKPLEKLARAMGFLTGDMTIGEIIAQCRQIVPNQRPDLATLAQATKDYREIRTKQATAEHLNIDCPTMGNIRIAIENGILGMLSRSMTSQNGLWLSRTKQRERHIGNEQSQVEVYHGWHTGVAGPLWLLAQCQPLGLLKGINLEPYYLNMEYLINNLSQSKLQSQGLYTGSAGMALAIAAGIEVGLVKQSVENIDRLRLCFSQTPEGLGIGEGIAGQGLALAHCKALLGKKWVDQKTSPIIATLLDNQEKGGYWPTTNNVSLRKEKDTRNKTAGILLFLLEYGRANDNSLTERSIMRGLHWLIKATQKKTKNADPNSSNLSMLSTLVLIKAYALLGDDRCKKAAETQINVFPPQTITTDFSLQSGMAGYGEVCLEAYRVFKNEIYLKRAQWVAEFFVHTQQFWSEEKGYWITDTTATALADLFTGVSGVIHFLLGYQNPNKIVHPLSLQKKETNPPYEKTVQN